MTKDGLTRFCSTDTEDFNKHAPWSFGEHSYATNGHVIVRIPRLEDVPDAEDEWKKKSSKTLFDIPAPSEWFPLADIKLPKVKKVDCSECDGDGTVTHEDCPDCSGHKCEVCGGAGKEEITREPVSIGNTHYQLVYLRLLKSLPNCRIGPHTNPMDRALFQFDGGDGLLMPMKPYGEWRPI
jgi:hypothetical protein